MTGVERIAKERNRQIEKEGWTDMHDDDHICEELAVAGACYAVASVPNISVKAGTMATHPAWPWEDKWFKPTPDDRIRELEKAGALIAAEIDRLQRIEEADDE